MSSKRWGIFNPFFKLISMPAFDLVGQLLVLCCYGGTPYVDLHLWQHRQTHHQPRQEHSFRFLDPTDWIAVDTAGSSLNVSIHPKLNRLIPDNVPLDECDLYNLTFTGDYFRGLFDRRNGTIGCKCPYWYHGTACHLFNSTMPRYSAFIKTSQSSGFVMAMFVLLLLGILLAATVITIKSSPNHCFCYWCDCFGACVHGNDDGDDINVDGMEENDLNRCLEAVGKHNRRQGGAVVDVSTVVEQSTTHRHSPPPSYKSESSDEPTVELLTSTTTRL